mgnify:CR=1 FL=1
MRSKEDAQDYRYFPDPDLVPLVISDEWIEAVKARQPELHTEKIIRYMEEYGLPRYDAGLITSSKHMAGLFEETVRLCGRPKEVSNWLMVEAMRLIKEHEMDADHIRFSPVNLAALIRMVEQGTLNAIRPVVYFRQFLETALKKDDVEQLKLLAEPLFQAKKKKMFDLKRLDEMLALRRGMDEEREEIESEEEADYVYDDELEEQRISSNYRILVRELFAMLKETDCFTLREWNEQLEVRYGQKIFANGDYYSFLVNLCQKHEIVIRDAVRHPATNFEAVLKQYFEIEGTEEELQMDFCLETLTDEEPVTFLECFSVTNIRVERMNGDDRADAGNRD